MTVVPPQTPVPSAPRVRNLPGAPRPRAGLGSRRRLTVAVVILVGAVGFLLYQGLGNAAVYFKTADEAVAQKAVLGTRTFRIEGAVTPGSIHGHDGVVDFSIAHNAVTVRVVHTGDPPQLFKDATPVVLEGHWVLAGPAGDYFASDLIMIKHSEDYKAAHPDRLVGATQ